jgi:SpoVK/Ycf46/Vps4 family AAA+-type ATPase
MTENNDLDLLVRGHTPIIAIESIEEHRVLEYLLNTPIKSNTPLFKWSVTEGLERLDTNLGPQKNISSAQDVLRHIKSAELQGLYVLFDMDPWLNDPVTIRLVKEIAMMFDGNAGKLILVSHQSLLPDGLTRLSVKFQLKLPNNDELEELIKAEAHSWQLKSGHRVRTDRETLTKLIKNLSGLSLSDAKRLIHNAIVNDGAINETDLPEVIQAKYRLLNRDGSLSFEYDTTPFSEVGGMGNLKKWLQQRQPAFSDVEGKSGLDRPKGILLLGVQGCGKSLAAKAVAGMWGIPLLRLDFGQLYNKYIGETERNLRQTLQTAEVMSPCVLWIDELEKGISGNNDEDGTSRRLLGTLLTWMAENKQQVFIVATANNIEQLPPELIRKGRMDEIFFVDLPNTPIRESILTIHLTKRKIDTTLIDVARLAIACDGFSGAEIEQAVVSVLYTNHETKNPIETNTLLEEFSRTRPLSVVMDEKIMQLRIWASDRTVTVD